MARFGQLEHDNSPTATTPPPQVKGKAAIDVLGARLGKSGGALAQQGLVVACGSILTGAPVLATLFSLVSMRCQNMCFSCLLLFV